MHLGYKIAFIFRSELTLNLVINVNGQLMDVIIAFHIGHHLTLANYIITEDNMYMENFM